MFPRWFTVALLHFKEALLPLFRHVKGFIPFLGTDLGLNSIKASIWALACTWLHSITSAVVIFASLINFGQIINGIVTTIAQAATKEFLANFYAALKITLTRSFCVNDKIILKHDGIEVSGTLESIGWLSSSSVRVNGRELVKIPTHKLTANVVRDRTHDGNLILYIPIEKLGMEKLKAVIDDMRDILSKSRHVDQVNFPRRVYYDDISVTGTLRIMVACHLNTTDYDVYLGMKEDILMELINIIHNHTEGRSN